MPEFADDSDTFAIPRNPSVGWPHRLAPRGLRPAQRVPLGLEPLNVSAAFFKKFKTLSE
jgi:hypothetical protein